MRKYLLTTSLLVLFVCSIVNKTVAQTTQASISGGISSNKKSPLPGATVQVRNESTGFTTSTVTDAQGVYLFKELLLGGPHTIFSSGHITQQFNYRVNATGVVTPSVDPFQIQLGARYGF